MRPAADERADVLVLLIDRGFIKPKPGHKLAELISDLSITTHTPIAAMRDAYGRLETNRLVPGTNEAVEEDVPPVPRLRLVPVPPVTLPSPGRGRGRDLHDVARCAQARHAHAEQIATRARRLPEGTVETPTERWCMTHAALHAPEDFYLNAGQLRLMGECAEAFNARSKRTG